jgi:hypothetical protein
MELPKRTNATDLTDNELLLFDFLFDTSLAFHHLRTDDYSFHMNCTYSHSLDDDRLRVTLASLVDRRLLNERIGPIFNVETGLLGLGTHSPRVAVIYGIASENLTGMALSQRHIGSLV